MLKTKKRQKPDQTAKVTKVETRQKSQSPATKEKKRDAKGQQNAAVAKKAKSVEKQKVEKIEKSETQASEQSKTTNSGGESPKSKSDKPTKSEARAAALKQNREDHKKEKEELEEKYDINLRDSDDSSDEENLLRIGNVPKEWYDLYDHKGYGVSGKQVEKMAQKDEITKFVEKANDPQWWRNITDELNNKEVRLSRGDLEMLMRIRKGKVADKGFNEHDEKFQFEYEHKELIHPFQSNEPKRRFVPSKWERLKVQKFLKALRENRMPTNAERKQQKLDKMNEETEKTWDIWEDDTIVPWKPKDAPKAIVAPKRDLPLHAESYNPPEEYLLDKDELEQYEEMDDTEKPYNFIPQKFESLRKVPLYQDLVREHFERCLDLYMCPRMTRKKTQVADPNMLIPELPSPNDLKPFPIKISVDFSFHKTCVRSIAISPDGRFLASGDEDSNLVVWDIRTARILRKYKLENKVIDCVEWSPSKTNCILSAANEEAVYVFSPGLYSRQLTDTTQKCLEQWEKQYGIDVKASDQKEKFAQWNFSKDAYGKSQIKIVFKHIISKVVWHSKGDYFSTLAHNIQTSSQVMIHSLSRSNSTRPFTQSKGIVQCISFHPTKPHFFACTHMQVFQYNLQKQQVVTKYQSGCKWISSIDVHPGGDNFVLGTYDRKIVWFDVDMGSKPYKNLKYHDKAIRNVKFSPKYPLFASCSDDGSVNIFYGMVFNDLLQNALIVPVKILKAHAPDKKTGLGAMDIQWHPTQPWVVTCGSEGSIKMWV